MSHAETRYRLIRKLLRQKTADCSHAIVPDISDKELGRSHSGHNVTRRWSRQSSRELAQETGLKADFVQGTVDEATRLTPGPFDLVFTTWGTINWLPDLKVWAQVIASVLAPGGELYFADKHPSFHVLAEQAGRLVPKYDFQSSADRPLEFLFATTYTGDPTIMTHQPTREWVHSLSTILGALIDAGLTIVMFREHEVLPWQAVPSLVPASHRLWP